MKVILFSGTHSRHLWVHKKILENFEVVGAVVMHRESTLPSPPEGIPVQDAENFRLHFKNRDIVEEKTYGHLDYKDVFKDIKNIVVEPEELNSQKVLDFVKSCKADLAYIFGVDLIKDPVLSQLPDRKVNLHLGLSPWYKGSATLFWPFYNLQPHWAGLTLHYIVADADAGDILHQSLPELKKGDTIHDVAARVVINSAEDSIRLLEKLQKEGHVKGIKQKTQGRLYLTNQFKPEHLRVIYDLCKDSIVDSYLKGVLKSRKPKLYSILD